MRASYYVWWLVRRPKFVLSMMFIVVLGLAGSLASAPVSAAPFISVSMTFTNTGQLPLRRRAARLDHGCWTNDVQPPDTIAPLTTVTFQAESCGVITGAEGIFEYVPYGSPVNSVFGHFFFDDPALGDNAASATGPTGCSVTHTDPPTSGNTITVLYSMGCTAPSGDGIADVWKLHGAEFDPGGGVGGQFIDLPAMGAAVGEKDIFVQIDWMQGTLFGEFNQQIKTNAIKRWVDLYAANGYRLHVDQGPNSIMNFATNATWGSLARGQAVGYQANLGTATVDAAGNITNYNWTAYNSIKATSFTPTGRAQIFHHILAAHQLGTLSNSGVSRTPGVDTIISLGTFTDGVGSEDEQLATLLHEFGHSLGLEHGGADKVNYKPNYFSVMNYAFQFPGITRNGVRTFDYSHNADTTLSENNPPGLNEASGVPSAVGYQTVHYCPAAGAAPAARVTVANAAGRIDWNCDGNPDANAVSTDVNNDPAEPANTLSTLTGYADWSRLKLAVGGIGSFGAGVAQPPITTIVDDPTPQMVQEIVPVDNVAPVSTAQAVPAPNAAGWNRSAVTVTLTATDDASGVARIEYNLDNAGYVAYTSPVVISTDLVHTLLYRAIDRVSNLETARSLTIKLDKTAPTVTYTGNTGTYNILATVNIACSAADNLSGVASSTCQDISGAAYTFAVGANAFSATATDVAGNTGSGSTSFTLVVTFADLRTLTAQFSSNPGVANGLNAKLDAAEASAARGNRTAQDNQIAAYQNDVRAQTGKALTSTQAATLIRLSNALL